MVAYTCHEESIPVVGSYTGILPANKLPMSLL